MEQRQQQLEKEQNNLTQQVKAMEEHIKSLQNLLSNRHETLRQLKHPTDNQTKTVTGDEQNELLEGEFESSSNIPTLCDNFMMMRVI
jgi:predicted RNase H-like nuclease (RuvC/YqgF family)